MKANSTSRGIPASDQIIRELESKRETLLLATGSPWVFSGEIALHLPAFTRHEIELALEEACLPLVGIRGKKAYFLGRSPARSNFQAVHRFSPTEAVIRCFGITPSH